MLYFGEGGRTSHYILVSIYIAQHYMQQEGVLVDHKSADHNFLSFQGSTIDLGILLVKVSHKCSYEPILVNSEHFIFQRGPRLRP